jgi:hypothetical protein
MFSIGAKVPFVEPSRPDAVLPGAIVIVVLIEPLPAEIGPPQRLRVKLFAPSTATRSDNPRQCIQKKTR